MKDNARRSTGKHTILLIAAIAMLIALMIPQMVLGYERGKNPAKYSEMTFKGLVHYDEMYEMVQLINDYRKSKGYNELHYDGILQQDAIYRAFEASITEGHSMLNGRMNTSPMFDEWCESHVGTENFGVVFASAGSAKYMFDLWKNSTDGHNASMLMNGEYYSESGTGSDGKLDRPTNIAIGAVSPSDGTGATVWIMLISGGKSSPQAPITSGQRIEERTLKLYNGENIDEYNQINWDGCLNVSPIYVGQTKNVQYWMRRKNSIVISGLQVVTPQSGVRFSTTSGNVRVDPLTGAVTALHSGVFDVIMTVDGVAHKTTQTALPSDLPNGSDFTAISLDSREWEYTGSEIRPVPCLINHGNKLEEGIDYTISYENNILPGTGKVIINWTHPEDYRWQPKISFTIKQRDLSNVQCKLLKDTFIYTGSKITIDDAIRLTDGNYTLVEGKDYDIWYNGLSKYPGEESAEITGRGIYTGTVVVHYSIEKKSTSTPIVPPVPSKPNICTDATTRVEYCDYYCIDGAFWRPKGEAIIPKITVKDGATVLKEGTDYILTYSNNDRPGTGEVKITGIGDWTGYKTIRFNIADTPELKLEVAAKAVTYSGKELKPSVIVKDANGNKLHLSDEYTVAYSNNVKVGTATVTVKGTYQYTGVTAKAIFKINPRKTKINAVTGKKSSITVKWTKLKEADAYQVELSLDKNFVKNVKRKCTKNVSSVTFKNLKRKCKYYMRVRAVKTIGSKTYYGSWSNVVARKTK